MPRKGIDFKPRKGIAWILLFGRPTFTQCLWFYMWIIVLALDGNCKSDVNCGIHVKFLLLWCWLNVSRLNLVSPSSGVASLRPRLGGELPWFTVLSHLQVLIDSLGNLELLMSPHVHRRERYCCVWIENKRKSHLGCEPECIVRECHCLIVISNWNSCEDPCIIWR